MKAKDILGIEPLATSVKIVTQSAMDGAAAFLGRICLPAAEEFGLLFRDKVSQFRTQNLVTIAQKAEEILRKNPDSERCHAHPRIVYSIIEKGTWSDNEDVQSMWAGLLASSCTQDGKDESTLMFIDILGRLTSAQAQFINYIAITTSKRLSFNGLPYSAEVANIPREKLIEIWHADIQRIDRELDYLRSLELISGGFAVDSEDTRKAEAESRKINARWEKMAETANSPATDTDTTTKELKATVVPTGIAINLYFRCMGYKTLPLQFFSQDSTEQK